MFLRSKEARRVVVGVGFLAPNIVGFLVFTLFPLVFSFAMAFTNWDLRLHNVFKDSTVRFIGFENFARLFAEPDFLKYLGNTLFLMMGIPFGVAGSPIAAILLSQDLGGRDSRVRGWVIAWLGLVAGVSMLVVAGCRGSAMTVLTGGIAGLILLGGALGGRTVYRTLFYFPHFTAGVATFLLWKKLYNPHTGPINSALRPLLSLLTSATRGMGPSVLRWAAWGCAVAAAFLVWHGWQRLRESWGDGEMGWGAVCLGGLLLCVPVVLGPWWGAASSATSALGLVTVAALVLVWRAVSAGRDFVCAADRGLGRAVVLCGAITAAQFALLGLANVCRALPAMAVDGLAPPEWLTQYHWSKPSLMIMGLWAAVGSNNMLLYLAGLSNVPTELYEAADIDGASRLQRFWHVTWPQLAPVTFFIAVMAVIHGLQGGFEMARTMTKGGPAGSTTTLSYYVYTEGLETGRLGYASAVAWALFALIFAVTLFNWKFGNRYVND